MGEVKAGSRPFVTCCPEVSMVIFHDRATDRKPHPKASLLGRLEGIEHLIDESGIESLPDIAHLD